MDCVFSAHIGTWFCLVTFYFLFVCSFILFLVPCFYLFSPQKQFYEMSKTRQHLRNFPFQFLVALTSPLLFFPLFSLDSYKYFCMYLYNIIHTCIYLENFTQIIIYMLTQSWISLWCGHLEFRVFGFLFFMCS